MCTCRILTDSDFRKNKHRPVCRLLLLNCRMRGWSLWHTSTLLVCRFSSTQLGRKRWLHATSWTTPTSNSCSTVWRPTPPVVSTPSCVPSRPCFDHSYATGLTCLSSAGTASRTFDVSAFPRRVAARNVTTGTFVSSEGSKMLRQNSWTTSDECEDSISDLGCLASCPSAFSSHLNQYFRAVLAIFRVRSPPSLGCPSAFSSHLNQYFGSRLFWGTLSSIVGCPHLFF